jgi:hypothetical protein
MSLLTSTNLANASNAHWMTNLGTDAAPVIAGNPVQLCTGGPIASSSGTANANNSLTAAGSNAATALLRLGTPTQTDALVLGPVVGGNTAGTLNARIAMAGLGSITSGAAGTQFVAAAGGQFYVDAGGEIDVQPGAVLKFNNAGAQRGTFRALLPLPDIPDATTQLIANPGSIVEGVYAIMVDCAGTTTNANRRGLSSVGYWTGTVWFGGCVAGASNMFLEAATGKAQLQIVNGTGTTLDEVSVRFVLLAGAA